MMDNYRIRINKVLANILPKTDLRLHEAMRYSVLNGGKRLRALLVYGAGEVVNADLIQLDNAAAAVELIHAYSLIHDDLPAMDNDDIRHGKPACHKAFDEALAILAGDALQSLAFEILARNQQAQMISTLAQAIGANGMALGQSLDIAAEKQRIDVAQLKNIHHKKTGALIQASIQLGVFCANSYASTLFSIISDYAEILGLAFQVQDDILDVEEGTERLGKPSLSDQKNNKATYPALLSLPVAKELLAELYTKTLTRLEKIERAKLLTEITKFIIHRRH